jgi:hypothetical protein
MENTTPKYLKPKNKKKGKGKTSGFNKILAGGGLGLAGLLISSVMNNDKKK